MGRWVLWGGKGGSRGVGGRAEYARMHVAVAAGKVAGMADTWGGGQDRVVGSRKERERRRYSWRVGGWFGGWVLR